MVCTMKPNGAVVIEVYSTGDHNKQVNNRLETNISQNVSSKKSIKVFLYKLILNLNPPNTVCIILV